MKEIELVRLLRFKVKKRSKENLGTAVDDNAESLIIYIQTYFSLRAKYWLRGGVCGQFPKNLNCSERIIG